MSDGVVKNVLFVMPRKEAASLNTTIKGIVRKNAYANTCCNCRGIVERSSFRIYKERNSVNSRSGMKDESAVMMILNI